MSDQVTGTLERLATEVGTALTPLKDLLNPELFIRLGIELPPSIAGDNGIRSKLSSAGAIAGELSTRIQALRNAMTGGDAGPIIAAAAKLFETVAQLGVGLKNLGDAVHAAANGLPPAEKTVLQDVAGKMASRTMEHLLVEYIGVRQPMLTQVMGMIGLLDKSHEISPMLEVGNVPPGITPQRFYLSKLPTLLSKPDEHFKQVFGWGLNGFDGMVLLGKLQALLESQGIPAVLYLEAGQPPVLEAYFMSVAVDTSTPVPGLKVDFSLPGNATLERTVDFTSLWKGKMKVAAAFDAGLGMELRPPFQLTLKPPSGNVSLDLQLTTTAEKSNGEPIDILSLTGGSRLQAKKLEAGLRVLANLGAGGGEVTPGLQFRVEKGKLIIDFSQGDGFLQKILSGIKLESEFSIEANWDPKKGISFVGDAGLQILLPIHIDLGALLVDGLYFKIGLSNSIPLQLGLATKLGINLGPMKGVVEEIGVNVNFSFPQDGKGRLGLADLDFKFQPPKGVGLSLDIGVVKGGGYLYFDTDKEEYAGALELSLFEIVTIKAIGLITTRMPDGSKGFSLLLIITAEFGTGIQLGFGFTLIGIGGLVGLNRTMKLDVLADRIRSGAANSVLFPVDVIANAPRIISDLRAIFPPEEGKFLVGPMVKIGWGTPTLVSLAMGVIIEIPGNFAIVGVLKVALPTEDAPLILLQVAFVGAIEPENSRVWFFASIFDSRIVFITIEGDMGLLMDFGDNPNFVLTVGGFHPMFSPPPLPFPNPRRIHLDVLRTPVSRITVEGYFAVTSNTVQFGAHAELVFGFDDFGLSGHFGFDALFQFSPFKFILQISFSVSLKAFGIGLFSISLRFSLEGPAPYRAKGSGSLSIFWVIDISFDFDFTWGEADNPPLPTIDVLPELVAELKKTDNWRAKLPVGNNLLVSLRKLDAGVGADTLVLHPLGILEISQSKVPLNTHLDKLGNRKAADAHEFRVTVSTAGLSKSGDAKQKFAIAQFQDLSNDEKLSRPAFQDLDGGLSLSVGSQQLGATRIVKRIIRYEVIIIDTNYKRFRKFLVRISDALFHHGLKGAAVAKSELSQAYKKNLVPNGPEDTIKVKAPGYVVASTENNKAHSATAVFASEAQARDYMNKQVAMDGNMAEMLHVIPAVEAAF